MSDNRRRKHLSQAAGSWMGADYFWSQEAILISDSLHICTIHSAEWLKTPHAEHIQRMCTCAGTSCLRNDLQVHT